MTILMYFICLSIGAFFGFVALALVLANKRAEIETNEIYYQEVIDKQKSEIEKLIEKNNKLLEERISLNCSLNTRPITLDTTLDRENAA